MNKPETTPPRFPPHPRRHPVKYEEVDLRAYDSVSDACVSLGRYLDFYNALPAAFEPGCADAGAGLS